MMREYYTYESSHKLTFGGSYDNWFPEQFADEAVKLYEDEGVW
jgi:hypothetical protein